MRTTAAVIALFCLPVLLPVGELSGQAPAAAPKDAQKPPFVFEAGDVPLRELIRRCADYLQYNVHVDDTEFAAATGAPKPRRPRNAAAPQNQPAPEEENDGPLVSMSRPVVTDRDGCEELLTGVLWSHGLALAPIDELRGVHEVLAINGQRGRELAMGAVWRTPEQVLARPTLRSWSTMVFPLQHTNATIACNALRPFLSTGGGNQTSVSVGTIGNSTALLLCGPQHLLATAVRILQEADVADGRKQTEIEQLLEAVKKENEELRQRVAALAQLEQRVALLEQQARAEKK